MSDKGKQVLSWIFGIAAIIFICMKDSSRDVKYVCAQAIVVWGLEVVGSIVGKIPYVGGIISLVVSIFVIVVWIMGLVKICQNKQGNELELPLVGKIADAIFGKLIEK